MSSVRDATGKVGNAEAIRPYADLIAALPEPPETFVRREMPGGNHREALQRLIRVGAIREVERERVEYDGDTSPSFRWVYRVERWAYETATDQVANRDAPMPCGHSGIRNLGDGEYACAYDGCDKTFRRHEVSV